MSDLLAMSFDMATSPSITLKATVGAAADAVAQRLPIGWGMGWYPTDEPAAVVIKDPTSSGDNAMSQVLRDWERFRSSIFLCHLRGAAQRITQRDTHPFIRSEGGRHWLMAHNGSLGDRWAKTLPLGEDPRHEPLGRTDTEHAFCWLLGRVHEARARSLSECGWPLVYEWLQQINALGTANVLLTDGQHLLVYQDANGFNPLHWVRLAAPDMQGRLENEVVTVDVDGVLDGNRTGIVFSTSPFIGTGAVHMSPGQMLVARRGSIVWDSLSVWDAPAPEREAAAEAAGPGGPAAGPPADAPPAEGASTRDTPPPAPPLQQGLSAQQSGGAGHPDSPGGAAGLSQGTARAAPCSPLVGAYTPPLVAERPQESGRVLSILHETIYRYAAPVEYSTHLLRLRPVHDARQSLREFDLSISVEGLQLEYEDVFGNHALRLELSTPYTELSIRTRAVVGVLGQPQLDLRPPFKRDQIPLVWMPWQRQMMLPYLLPPELAESELRELHEFAMSFVERNDYELLETLLDINRTIFRDFAYVSGSTTLSTTPYEVYMSRRGVCQDFANLLICLARLLNVPARYRAGYIYTGGNYENRVQSDASHAWAELYLPWVGWHGFDPTNGILVGADHVRVACGRNFQDSTPTSGTIYRGGGNEQLFVSVQVDEVP